MSLVVVGSVALDTVETPFGRADAVLGGSGSYFSAAASLFHPVRLVGVIGDDFPVAELDFLRARGVDLDGLERAAGPSFHWVGRYDFDLNTAHTIDTRLGVFADFAPVLPEAYRDAEWVFLANIDPDLQLDVLEQVAAPRFVACDTMNYWIQGKKDALLRLLERIDIVLLNDAEIRQLTGKANLLRAARDVMERGPRAVVVKKGEHGAMLFTPEGVFFVPGFPLETVFDPTGAGDSFAGGFLGYLAAGGTVDIHHLRRAMVYGSAMGSFAVERFSAGRLKDLTIAEVHARVRDFRTMTHFELAEPVAESPGTAPPA
ncbi:MAG TPA: PfkB family carbohydrate kinase [Longimicrobiales bacterium]|nr:PfkB family carbohydrate kinase [Longimicrobiales bacterium]